MVLIHIHTIQLEKCKAMWCHKNGFRFISSQLLFVLCLIRPTRTVDNSSFKIHKSKVLRSGDRKTRLIWWAPSQHIFSKIKKTADFIIRNSEFSYVLFQLEKSLYKNWSWTWSPRASLESKYWWWKILNFSLLEVPNYWH